MSLTELVALKEPFTPGAPTAPSSGVSTMLGTLWGYGLWILAAVACFALLGAVFMFFEHKSNGNNEGMKKAGWVIGGCVASGFILGVIGTVTGT